MSSQNYSKVRLSVEQQLELLKFQGLIIHDEAFACHVLKIVSYYRLSGYFHLFKITKLSNHKRAFKSATTFEKVWELYRFDRELRLLASSAIEGLKLHFVLLL